MDIRVDGELIRQTSGEFVCILSAHSLPIGPDFLPNALAPFADPTIAAVRFIRAVIYEATLYACLKTVPLQAKRKCKIG
jgi:hypothetical protein